VSDKLAKNKGFDGFGAFEDALKKCGILFISGFDAFGTHGILQLQSLLTLTAFASSLGRFLFYAETAFTEKHGSNFWRGL
jgi:hypothetical protein